jgi:hypothetical protein
MWELVYYPGTTFMSGKAKQHLCRSAGAWRITSILTSANRASEKYNNMLKLIAQIDEHTVEVIQCIKINYM